MRKSIVSLLVVLAVAANAQEKSTAPGARKALEDLHAKYRGDTEGKNADYIPQLAKVDAKLFGIAIVTVDGKVYEVGDTKTRFTIQSVAKPFVYSLALDDHGVEDVTKRVGVEPTGLPFNSIIASEVRASPLQNPLVNAGAIAVASLIKGKDPAEKYRRAHERIEAFAGSKLEIDNAVYESEMATNKKNLSIANLLLNGGLLYGDVEDSVERYTRAGCIAIHCRDLAIMGATLANRGVNPVTKKVVLTPGHVTNVLSVMTMAGMYDYSGEWFFRVGLPAKSGVGGGIVAVVPGNFAIATFAPPLDKNGNSVKGIKVITELSKRWNLHLLKIPGRAK
ncbi:MAG: glutaminase A [Planctomycetota bacterium]|jgi:glutaminase